MFWTTIRRLRVGKQCTVNTVYSGDDVLLTLTKDVMDRWRKYLLNPTDMPSGEKAGGPGNRILLPLGLKLPRRLINSLMAGPRGRTRSTVH